MNILHHKSYHVYNKKNIEKVKKDEAEADKQAKVNQDRVTLAESESRLTILRQRANVNLPAPAQEPIQHINLFQDLSKQGNQEHEAEVKEKDDKWNKQITMYLEKGSEKEPWYAKETNMVEKYKDKDKFKRREHNDSKSRKKKPIKLLDDPLDDIKRQLKIRERKDRKLDKPYHTNKRDKIVETETSSIEELRKKRKERERNERFRVEQLFLGPNQAQVTLDERKMAYNSQFNKQETDQAHKRRH